jgi:hypothetical protein
MIMTWITSIANNLKHHLEVGWNLRALVPHDIICDLTLSFTVYKLYGPYMISYESMYDYGIS